MWSACKAHLQSVKCISEKYVQPRIFICVYDVGFSHLFNILQIICLRIDICIFIYFQAYELSTLTGTQVMLLVASETGHVYTFATRKLQPMITSDAGKALIQTCLNSPDPPAPTNTGSNDQRMSATGYEETELTYNVADDVAAAAEQQQKVRQMMYAANSHYSVAAAAHNLFPGSAPGQHPGAGGPLPPSHQSPMNSNMHQHASNVSPYGHPAPSPSPSALHHPSTYGVSSLSPTTLSSHSPGPSAHHALATSSHSPSSFIPQHSVAGR